MSDLDNMVLNFSAGNIMLLNAILAIVMFSIALDLRPSDFHKLAKSPRPVITGLVSQFMVLPALTFLLVLALQPSASVALGLTLVAACPGGNISNFITHRAGGNTALSVSLTAFATVGAIVLTPLNIAFWGSLYAPSREILQTTHIDPVQVAITISLMLLLPLCLGIALNTRFPGFADRIRRIMQNVSMVIFAAFIVLALQANWDNFMTYAGALIGIVVLHNALALIAGNMAARAAGLSEFDRRAVTIETGIQNSGLGLVLIFAFFDGLGGMAVVAALWGIWHAISGIGLAWILSRKEVKPCLAS